MKNSPSIFGSGEKIIVTEEQNKISTKSQKTIPSKFEDLRYIKLKNISKFLNSGHEKGELTEIK